MVFLPGYRRACPLTVASAQITGTLADPVFVVSATNMPSGAWSGADSFSFENLRDLRFTLVDGTPLNHELVQGSKAGSLLQAHVHLPSAAVGTVIYAQWQNPAAVMPTTAFQQATWPAYALGVWHCEQTSGHLTDSTANGNTATKQTGAGYDPGYGPNGRIGRGVGPSNYANVGWLSTLVIPADHAIMCWNYWPSLNQAVLCGGSSGGHRDPLWTSGGHWYTSWGGIDLRFTTDGALNAWQHFIQVTRGTSLKPYLQGSPDGSGTMSSPGALTNLSIAYDPCYPYYLRNGYIDEVRVYDNSSGFLTDAWAAAEFNSQSAPGTFWGTGSILVNPLVPSVPLPILMSGRSR